MKKSSKSLFLTIILFIIFVLYTILVKYLDVAPIGPNLTEVGFSTLNSKFHTLTGYNDSFYNITKYLGIIPFILVAYYGIIGLKQLVKNKKLSKVDPHIIILGCFYILVGLCYVLFEKIIINYRPIILDGILEASYPSSHTVLAITICASSLLISKYYFKNQKLNRIVNILTWFVMIFLVIGRLLSGVHWLTDIIGGILLSNFLIALFYYVNQKLLGE